MLESGIPLVGRLYLTSAIYGHICYKMPKGTSLNLYVPKRQVALLDSIAAAMGEGEIGIQPTRSQLVSKAIENFIEACQKREDLRRAIETSNKEFVLEPRRTNSRDKSTQRLSLVSPAS